MATSYREPDVYGNRQIQEVQLPTVEAALPALQLAPLYHVVNQGQAAAKFNALTTSEQAFVWPDHKIGAVIDLAGTSGGIVDDQRKDLAEFPPTFYLKDPQLGTISAVDDVYVQAIGQSGFELIQGARTGKERASLNLWVLNVDGSFAIYRPPSVGTTGFSSVRPTDRFKIASTDYVVASRSDTVLTPVAAPAASSTVVQVKSDGTQVVNITLGASPGRVVAAVGTSNFATLSAAFGVGDPAVVYAHLPGFTAIAGAVQEVTGTFVKVDSLVISAVFSAQDLVGKYAKVVNATAASTSWRRVTAYDPDTLILTLDGAVGTADNDVVTVTVYDAVIGYVESFNVATTEVTLVTGRTFAAAGTAIDTYPTSEGSISFWPDFNVLCDYRELRKDLAGRVYSSGTESEFLTFTGHDSIVPEDGLGFLVRTLIAAQGTGAQVYWTAVDIEPAGTTGLPENADLVAGYTAAYVTAGGSDVYALSAEHQELSGVQAAGLAHNVAMNLPGAKRERAMFTWARVPMGELESSSGVIEPGRTLNGTASSDTVGNKLIRQAGAEFVSSYGVVEGTQVVVTYPPIYAGTYTALGATTDDILVLSGSDWEVVKYKSIAVAGLSIATVGGIHTLSGAPTGHWRLVEAGDYLHLDVTSQKLRLRVVTVSSDGTTLTLVDEAAGDLDLSAATLAGTTFIARSWGSGSAPPAVSFYVRPLTPEQQKDQLIASKTIVSKDVCMILDYSPTLQVGLDGAGEPVLRELSPSVALAAVVGLRTGNDPHQDFSRLALGAGIQSVKWGFNHFNDDQLNALAQAGFLLIKQETQRAQPIIRDALTTNFAGGEVTSQETVTANSAWQIKTLRLSLRNPAGKPLKRNSSAVAGLRSIQVSGILQGFKDQERLIGWRDLVVSVDPQKKTRTTVSYTAKIPVAEKEIDIFMNLEV